MSIVVYKTDAIIVAGYEDAKKLVEWASDIDTYKLLVGKTILIVEPGLLTAVKPAPEHKAIIGLFCHLLKQHRRLNLVVRIITNEPFHLDERIKVYVEQVGELNI